MDATKKNQILLGIIIIILLAISIGIFLMEKRVMEISNTIQDIKVLNELKTPIQLPQRAVEVKPIELTAKITGYNSSPEQTDSTPCYAGNEYICGRDDVVACPRAIPKGTWVKIEGKLYECLDRMNLRYENQDLPYFDIFFGEDIEMARRWGVRELSVAVYLTTEY